MGRYGETSYPSRDDKIKLSKTIHNKEETNGRGHRKDKRNYKSHFKILTHSRTRYIWPSISQVVKGCVFSWIIHGKVINFYMYIGITC